MQKSLSLFLLILSLSASSLFAVSMGKKGTPTTIEEVSWQPMYYQDSITQMLCKLPGSPKSGVSGGTALLYSTHEEVYYEVSILCDTVYHLPKSINDFMKQFKSVHTSATNIRPVDNKKKNVRYAIEATLSPNTVCRCYVTEQSLYTFLVAGKDTSLKDRFFNSIEVVK